MWIVYIFAYANEWRRMAFKSRSNRFLLLQLDNVVNEYKYEENFNQNRREMNNNNNNINDE